MSNFFQKNKKIILAVVLIGLIAAPLALVPTKITLGDGPVTTVASWFGKAVFGADVVQDILDVIANTALIIAGLITAFAGWLFNLAAGFSLNISAFLSATPFIDTAWETFRDLANMFFIFILLYVAIKTILGDNPGKMLASIIITALLVNFSMFFTKVAIDASNILALNFYNAINIQRSAFDIRNSSTWGIGLSDPFMHALAIQTTYPKDTDLAGATYGSLFKAAGATVTQRILSQTVGVLVMLIAAFVFFAGAWMFVARTVILLFLLMFSPIAVVSRLTPKSKGIWDKWSGALIKQLIFAPAFMIMVWVVINIIGAESIKTLMSGGFVEALQGDVNAFGVLFGYAFIIALLIMTLIVSQVVGASGAAYMISWGQALRKGAQGWAGRNTFGATARGIADSDKFKDWASRHPTMGRAAFTGLGKVSSARFSSTRGGYDAAQEKAKETKTKFATHVASGSGRYSSVGGTTPTTSTTSPLGTPPGTPPSTPPPSTGGISPIIKSPPIIKGGVDVEIEKILGKDKFNKVSGNERFMRLARYYYTQKFGSEIIKDTAKKVTGEKDEGKDNENIPEAAKKIRERIEDQQRHDDIVSDLRKIVSKLENDDNTKLKETVNKSKFSDDEKKKLLDILDGK